MAIDDSESDDSDQQATSVDHFQRLEKQAKLQWLLALIVLPLMVFAFMAGMIGLGNLHKSTLSLLTDKPESFVERYTHKIDAAKNRAEGQYQQLVKPMSEASTSRQFNRLYTMTADSDRDYVGLLEVYQQLTFAQASGVKGSGEWYYYFKKNIDEAINKAKKHQAELEAKLLEPAI